MSKVARHSLEAHYSVYLPVLDKRGDSVLIEDFEKLGKLDPSEDELATAGYKHPNVNAASAQLSGPKNQDRVIVQPSEDDDSLPHYFGVFDGHGLTATAADLCTEKLHSLIYKIDKEMRLDLEDEKAEKEEPYVVPCDEAIVEAFHEMDKEIRGMAKTDPRTGTCAVVLMLGKRIKNTTNGKESSMDSRDSTQEVEGIAKVAWVGDSRCIFIENGSGNVHDLSLDHRLDSHEGELERLKKNENEPRKGLVESDWWKKMENSVRDPENLQRKSFIGRRREGGPLVLFAYSGGISLQITRSLGDINAARSAIPTPEIRTIVQQGDEFASGRFVMASDGLWDIMESEAVAKFVKKYSDPKVAASKLCAYAKNKRVYKGMYPDDISVVVVDVNGNGTEAQDGNRKNSRCKVM